VHSGWIDRDGFLRWREAYENAGIDPREAAPATLRALAAGSGVVVASNVRRAIESAQHLSDREIVTSPLLRELDLVPPRLGRLRLPLLGWAIAIGIRGHVTADEKERAGEAIDWLAELAGRHGSVLAVTHGSFRAVAAKELLRRGWQLDPSRRTIRHWSAWTFTSGMTKVLRASSDRSVSAL
jgi:broad specificity phosphatase PhoE